MLKIGFITFGCDSGRSGIGRYAIELLSELAKFDNEVEIEVAGHANEKEIFARDVNVKWLNVSNFYSTPLKNIIWHQFNLINMAKKRGWDAVFLPAGNRRLPFFCPVATTAVVHDFSALHVTNKYDSNRMFYIKKVLPALMRRLTSVITISRSSMDDIINFARVDESNISIIHHGVDHKRYFPADQVKSQLKVNKKFGFSGPYILYISRIEHPGKNHFNLIKAFEMLANELPIDHKLVLAGSDWDRAKEIHALAEKSKFSERIVFTGFAKNEDLPELVNGCDLFVFPSLYEGFGMPILEAMACKVPVACSNISSMPEVAGDSAELFSPQDPVSIKNAIKKLLSDKSHANRLKELGYLRTKSFTWQNTARKTLDIIIKSVEKKRSKNAR